MDHVVPDWHTFGAEPVIAERADAAAAATPPWRKPRVIALGSAALIVAVMSLITFAWLLAPAAGAGVVIDGGSQLRPASARGGGVAETRPADRTAFSVADVGAVSLVAGTLTVDVEGAVQRPGLVHVAAGDRIGDAIRLAGGFSARADLRAASTDLNLAQSLSDGFKVVIPEIGADAAPATTDTTADAPNVPSGTSQVDLNKATQAELEALPGIGPVTAGHIIEARTQQLFASVDDLRSRSLVGAATFDKLKALVTVAR